MPVVSESGKSAAQIMRRDRHVHSQAVVFDDLKDACHRQRRTANAPGSVQGTKYSPAVKLHTLGPQINGNFAPGRDRYGSDPLVFANQIDNHPSTCLLYTSDAADEEDS